ncbi:MAG: AMP-binding protein [Nanoarchaeota archaeon]
MDWKKIQKKEGIVFHKNKLNIIETIEKQAQKNPNKTAIVFQSQEKNNKIQKLTYQELIKKTNQFANYLKQQDIKPNSRIFIFLPKTIDYYYLFLGIIKAGSIPCPIFEAFQEQGLYLRLDRGDANLVITNSILSKKLHKNKYKTLIINKKFKQELNKKNVDFKPVLKNKKDTCIMIFTSSTAGTPVAGIQIPHQAIIQWKYTGKKVLKLNKNTRYFCSAHPAWITGSVYSIITPLTIGCTIYNISGRFNPLNWIKFFKENKIQIIYTAPTVLRLLKNKAKKPDFKHVKYIFSVGEALQQSIVDYYKKFDVKIIDTYWQTETGAIVIANINQEPGSLGQEINVKTKTRNNMILIKKPWPAMMTGIYKHKKMYNQYFSGKEFKTFDLAKKKNNNFYFSGRKDDIIKTSGERVSPIEIENVLLKHPSVKETAVIGIPDKTLGEIIKAFVVLDSKFKKSSNLKKQLSSFVKKNYAGHSYPKEIEFIDKLPKGNSGKIIKDKLKR